MEWIYADSSDQQHRFVEADFPSLVREGKITRETLVWNESMTDWRACGQVRPNLFVDAGSAPVPPPPMAPSSSSQVLTPATVNPAGYPATPITPTSGTSIAALVCGILGILSCVPLFSIAAVICGHIGMKHYKQNPDNSTNKGFSLTGLITGYVMIALAIVFIIFMGVVIYMEEQGLTDGIEAIQDESYE